MEDNFEQLVNELFITPLSIDVLSKLTFLIEQQTFESDSLFVSQFIQSLLVLEHWAWKQLSYDSYQWINQPNYLTLFHTFSSFNKNLILNFDNIEVETKALLLISCTVDQINSIFEQINQSNNDNDPFIAIISFWLNNLAFFIHENPQFDTSPIICHINQYIGRNYVMTDQFKFYLTQLQQSNLPQSIFTTKQLFYIKTCLFSLSSYLTAKAQNFLFTAEEILHHVGNKYLQIINIHSHTMELWSKEFLICITYLTGFIGGCCWWGGEKLTHAKILFSTEQISYDLVQGLIRIISYKPIYKEIKNERLILIDIILKFLLFILQTQNMIYVFRSHILLPDILLTIVENSSCDKLSLCAYAILSEILTDEKLKELKITNNICNFLFNILEQGWHHPLKKYKQMPIIYLLRSFSSLSKSNTIQQKVSDGHKLSFLIEMCDEYPIIYDIIWAFSFNQDIQQQLRSNSSFMSKLSQLSKECDNEQMSKMIHGILWNLEINHENRSTLEIKNGKRFDIMISYSHKDKIICKQIYDELIKSSYRIWIDFDQMHGNVMDAMAQAIEQSHTIIICMSEQYRKSNYCRAEAQYAFQQQRKIVPVLLQKQYKPDGWLLFLIGQLYYVDFIKYEFSRAMEILFKELKATNIGDSNADNVQFKENAVVTSHVLQMSSLKLYLSPILPEKITDWTQIHVQEWLTRHNLIHLSRLLVDCNGSSLLYLDDLLRHGDIKQTLSLLQEDSLRRTGHSLSYIELSIFGSLMNEQKLFLQSNVAAQVTTVASDNYKKCSLFCCPIM
ncbi:unnamed protein product [Rotaria sordida]|uniref:TIR domain-containing protein n=1 Tax=Rotaria sordida TaxID=392033 RepID=A0A814DAF3_9BILA|nr:unnamed protein product [Rotaria sordida]